MKQLLLSLLGEVVHTAIELLFRQLQLRIELLLFLHISAEKLKLALVAVLAFGTVDKCLQVGDGLLQLGFALGEHLGFELGVGVLALVNEQV